MQTIAEFYFNTTNCQLQQQFQQCQKQPQQATGSVSSHFVPFREAFNHDTTITTTTTTTAAAAAATTTTTTTITTTTTTNHDTNNDNKDDDDDDDDNTSTNNTCVFLLSGVDSGRSCLPAWGRSRGRSGPQQTGIINSI